MKRAYVDTPKGQMHYRFGGTGSKSVICIHMSGSSSDEFEGFGELMVQRGYRVYALDLFGFGPSDPPSTYYSLSDHAQTVLDFMDALHISNAVLYGNLASGNLAVHSAILSPEKVEGLFLTHPIYSDDANQFHSKRHRPEYEVIVPQIDGSHLMEMWRRAAKYGATAAIADARCRCLYQAGDLCESLHWALFEDEILSNLLPKIVAPTVVIAYGTFGDPLQLRQAADQMQKGTYHLLEEATPYTIRSTPEQLVELYCQYF